MNTEQIAKEDVILHKTGYVTLIIGMFFLVHYLWSVLTPIKVLDVKNTTWAVNTKIVEAGEEVEFIIDFCKYRDYENQVTKNLIGEQGIFILQSSTSRFPAGCRHVTQRHVIPKNVPTGEYYIDVHLRYRVNQYRDVDYSFKTDTFIVKNSVLDGEVK